MSEVSFFALGFALFVLGLVVARWRYDAGLSNGSVIPSFGAREGARLPGVACSDHVELLGSSSFHLVRHRCLKKAYWGLTCPLRAKSGSEDTGHVAVNPEVTLNLTLRSENHKVSLEDPAISH